MALRMTEEEYLAWKQRQKQNRASPTCCQPAKPSSFSWDDLDAEEAVRLEKNRVAMLEQVHLDATSEVAAAMARKKRNKYGNTRVEVDGIRFDSKHEAAVYQDLMLRVRAGELKCVCRQVRFDLGGGPHADKGSRYAYIADFVTIDQNGKAEVLDAKSEATRKNRTYINKRKQMLSEWGLEVKEV